MAPMKGPFDFQGVIQTELRTTALHQDELLSGLCILRIRALFPDTTLLSINALGPPASLSPHCHLTLDGKKPCVL